MICMTELQAHWSIVLVAFLKSQLLVVKTFFCSGTTKYIVVKWNNLDEHMGGVIVTFL